MKSLTDIIYCENGQMLDVHLPEAEFESVFVYFHGGGLKNGSKDGVNEWMTHLLDRNVAVISANYRMYPDAKFPEFIEDAAAAVAWAFKNYPHKKIFVGGSSAGGYLSMMLCFDEKYLAAHGIATTDVAGYIHNAGQPTGHFNVMAERGLDSRRVIVDESAPLYFVGLQSSLAPMIFLVSDNDMQNRYEQTMLMLSTLKHFDYDFSKIDSVVLHGRHCQHDNALDENGESVFGKIIEEFIGKY